MNVLRVAVLVSAVFIARWQAKDQPPAPVPPDDSLDSICSPRCQLICGGNINCCLHCNQ